MEICNMDSTIKLKSSHLSVAVSAERNEKMKMRDF